MCHSVIHRGWVTAQELACPSGVLSVTGYIWKQNRHSVNYKIACGKYQCKADW